ncbi:MAG: hypothetical protein AABW88_05620 [Nanoarchaeota archaeon]
MTHKQFISAMFFMLANSYASKVMQFLPLIDGLVLSFVCVMGWTAVFAKVFEEKK